MAEPLGGPADDHLEGGLYSLEELEQLKRPCLGWRDGFSI